jgi:RHS repeat-associated protein
MRSTNSATALDSAGITLDSAGNATSFKGTSHSYNSNNQDTGNTYDGNGNPTTYQSTACTFDPENRMTAFGSALTATYRGDGLRAKTVTSAGTTYFLYDGEVLMAEMNSSGVTVAVYTWGAGGLVSRTTSSGTTSYTFDPEGNTAQRLSGTGSILTSDVYDAYGAGLSTGSADCCGFVSQWGYYTDLASGLLLLTRRYYNPAAGAFMTRDPISYDGGIGAYSYVANNPPNAADPSGFVKVFIGVSSVVKNHDHARIILVGNQPGDRGQMFKFEADSAENGLLNGGKWGPVVSSPGTHLQTGPDAFPKKAGIGIPGNPQVDSMTLDEAKRKLFDFCNKVNKANLPYSPRPTELDGTYNSNSFAHGALDVLGVVAPTGKGPNHETAVGGLHTGTGKDRRDVVLWGWNRPIRL